MAQISATISWDPVPGAADYRVRATDLSLSTVGNTVFVVDTSVPLADILAGAPVGQTYVIYVAAKDVEGPGQGTPGAEGQVQLTLEGLPAPTNVTVV